MSQPIQRGAAAEQPSFFIPDLCTVRAVFLLILVGELLALVLGVSRFGLRQFSWEGFATLSLFVQWILLLSAAGLCRLRPRLSRWPRSRAATLSYLWVLLVTALASACGQWLLIETGDRGLWPLDGWQILENVLICAVLAGIALRYLYLAQELRQRQRAELEARIQALQSRIRPHFLFNSMNSIASLIGIDPVAAEAAVEDLAALFRASLGQASTEVTVAEEVELCRRYLRIEQWRLGSRLRVDWALEALPESLPIPSLSLQPLLENAVYHGVQSRPEGGLIAVRGHYSDGWMRFEVSNPWAPGARQPVSGNRMALDNIGRRLQALYGEDAGIVTEHDADQFRARLFYRVEGHGNL